LQNPPHSRPLSSEIADFTPSGHAQSDIPGHAFRKRWLFTEISNMLRIDDWGLVLGQLCPTQMAY